MRFREVTKLTQTRRLHRACPIIIPRVLIEEPRPRGAFSADNNRGDARLTRIAIIAAVESSEYSGVSGIYAEKR